MRRSGTRGCRISRFGAPEGRRNGPSVLARLSAHRSWFPALAMPPNPDEPSPSPPSGFTCPRCRYDTRGLQSDRCPECGTSRAQAAELVRSRRRRNEGIVTSALGTIPALLAAFLAHGLLRHYYSLGFYDDAERVRAVTTLALLGGTIAIAAINCIRVVRGVNPLRFWWIGAAFCGLSIFLLLGSPMYYRA